MKYNHDEDWREAQRDLFMRLTPREPKRLYDEAKGFVFLGAPHVKDGVFRVNVLTPQGVRILQGPEDVLGMQCATMRLMHGDRAEYCYSGGLCGTVDFVRQLPHMDLSTIVTYDLEQL